MRSLTLFSSFLHKRLAACRGATVTGKRPGGMMQQRFSLLVVLCACFFCCSTLMAEATPDPVPPQAKSRKAAKIRTWHTPFSHYANQEPLPAVLMAFAQSQGYGAIIADNIQGVVNARFENMPPNDFLQGMRVAFNVAWYVLGDTLHFYPASERTRMFITPKATTPQRMYDTLSTSGVLSPDLPASLAPDGSMIIVYGPPSYLAEVKNATLAFEENKLNNVVMRVFPLHHAWADDIHITSMSTNVTIPGVASILRAMVTGQGSSGTVITTDKASAGGLMGSGLAAQGVEAKAPQADSRISTGAMVGGTIVNIMPDPRVNSVLVTDAEYRMSYYEKVIAELDKPVELVEIHAAIVDINSNFTRDLGVTYQGNESVGKNWSGSGSLSPDGSSFVPVPPMGQPDGAGFNFSTIYTAGANFFVAKVQALEATGEGRVLGRPSVLTVDNVQASLENTTTYYVKLEGYQTVDLFKVEAGTILQVTPHIIHSPGKQDSIKLVVAVQDNQNTDSSTFDGSTVPPISQTKINTQAIVETGQSLLIGGYYFEQLRDTDTGIPILMHLPWIGHLFKTSSQQTQQMERLILLTPRIVRLDEIQSIPNRVDEKSFHISPTQPNYEMRTPQAPSSGCSGKRVRSSEPDAAPVQKNALHPSDKKMRQQGMKIDPTASPRPLPRGGQPKK